jgi:cysteine desulfurase / selenocysteine lyase
LPIYLDHAATSFPKPETVCRKMTEVIRRIGANPGRADHAMARKADRVIGATREQVARLFGIEDPRSVIFTGNATEALNLALKGVLSPGDAVLTSSVEHNSVIRPLKALERAGVRLELVSCSPQGNLTLGRLKKRLVKKIKLIALTHGSNVSGAVLPIAEVGQLAKSKGILFLVDAAQTGGALPIDVSKMNIDLLACSGHKGLYGPQGTGFLYIRPGLNLEPLKEGGTGTESESEDQPEALPTRFESGTLNTPGIAGLGAGVSFVLEEGVEQIRKKEQALVRFLLGQLKKVKGVRIYGPAAGEERVPLVSFNLDGLRPGEVAFILDTVYHIYVRAGLHCAPQAHRTLGTFPNGTVRASLGFFNTPEDIKALIKALREISGMRS